MTRQDLEASVKEASRRYTNATALYEGAEQFPSFLDVHRDFSHAEVLKIFGGSCIEQIRAVQDDGYSLDFLRSNALQGDMRSNHWAALTHIEDQDFIVDPNISPIPICLSDVKRNEMLTLNDLAPRTSETTTKIVVAKGDIEGTYIVDKSKSRGQQEQKLRHERFDVREVYAELPDIITDLQTPLVLEKLLFEIAIDRGSQEKELLRILHDDQGTVLNWSGAGTKISSNRRGFDDRFNEAAQAYDVDADTLQTVIREAWQIYKKLHALGQDMRTVLSPKATEELTTHI